MSRVQLSLLDLPHHARLSALHLYCFLHVEIPTAIRDQEQSLAVLPNKARLRGTSPTISLKSTTRRLRLYSPKYAQAELRLVQARTPLQPPSTRKLMVRRLWECWLHQCTHRRERQVQTHHEFITLTEKIRVKFITFPTECS